MGCGSPRTSSSLEVDGTDGGGTDAGSTTIRANWTYRSTEVDIDIDLLTVQGPEECVTAARLVINTLTAARETYPLEDTECQILKLDPTGDIVLYDAPTGHDWSAEELRVDTERETIELGPWTAEQNGGVSYRFTLSAPECGDDCDCPELRRRAGSEDSVLPFARRCS